MPTRRHGKQLDAWITAVEADEQPRHVLRHHTAVLDGLTMPHSSGPVEGAVNRCKRSTSDRFTAEQLDLPRKEGPPHKLTHHLLPLRPGRFDNGIGPDPELPAIDNPNRAS